tara:strand:+ start:3755 stop:3988 length:234 start_codon:yes stop_codon:yes gene_type:complete
MSKFVVVKDVNEDLIIVDEAACGIRLWKALIDHCVIVYPKNFVKINLIFENFFFSSGHFFKVSQIELSIIKVNNCKL